MEKDLQRAGDYFPMSIHSYMISINKTKRNVNYFEKHKRILSISSGHTTPEAEMEPQNLRYIVSFWIPSLGMEDSFRSSQPPHTYF